MASAHMRGLILAAAAAQLGVGMISPRQEPRFPREVGPKPRRRARWNNDGVRSGKQFRLKGVRP